MLLHLQEGCWSCPISIWREMRIPSRRPPKCYRRVRRKVGMNIPSIMTRETHSGMCRGVLGYMCMHMCMYVLVLYICTLTLSMLSIYLYSLDCYSMKPIYKGSPDVKCSYCNSSYAPEYKGKQCVTCNIATVGVETMGLVTMNSSNRK